MFSVKDQFGAMVFGMLVGGAAVFFFRPLVDKAIAWVRGRLGK